MFNDIFIFRKIYISLRQSILHLERQFLNQISLTQFQINFLDAIADGVELGFSKTETLSKYNLGTAANIKRLKDSLENKELIDIDGNKVTFNDPVFKLWFRNKI